MVHLQLLTSQFQFTLHCRITSKVRIELGWKFYKSTYSCEINAVLHKLIKLTSLRMETSKVRSGTLNMFHSARKFISPDTLVTRGRLPKLHAMLEFKLNKDITLNIKSDCNNYDFYRTNRFKCKLSKRENRWRCYECDNYGFVLETVVYVKKSRTSRW